MCSYISSYDFLDYVAIIGNHSKLLKTLWVYWLGKDRQTDTQILICNGASIIPVFPGICIALFWLFISFSFIRLLIFLF